MLGLGLSDDPQDVADCNCLYGTPYRDASGNCRCANDDVQPWPPGTGGIRPPFGGGGPRGGVYDPSNYFPPATVNNTYNFPFNPQPIAQALGDKAAADASSPTIFGMSPLLVLALAGGGLWILSSMDDGKKK